MIYSSKENIEKLFTNTKANHLIIQSIVSDRPSILYPSVRRTKNRQLKEENTQSNEKELSG